MDVDVPADRPRPSWQDQPCPDWCTRVHHEDDHPEDRFHHDEGVVIAAVLAEVDPVDLSRVAMPTELIVQRSQWLDDPQVWVFIGESETARRLVVAVESVPRLRAGLHDALT